VGIAVKTTLIIPDDGMATVESEHLSLFEEERGTGYCLCFGMSMLPILGLLLLALPHVTISNLP
jgi:hypothetical protein